MPDSKTQSSFKSFSESLKSKKLSPVNPSSITGGRSIKVSGANIAKKEVEEFGQVRKILGGLLALEKRYYQFLGDRILHFSREEDKNKLKQEELDQEKKKKKGKDKEKNPVLEKAKTDLSMIGGFFKNLLKFFVGYKVLEWASKKENVKKIQDFANLFIKLFKFISAVTNFGVDVLMKTLTVTSKVINGVFDFIGKVGEFFSFRWLGGGVEWLLSTIENATSVIASIPNAITLTVKFLTDLIPNFLESVLTQGLFGSQKELQDQADQAIETKQPTEPATPTTESDSGQKDLGNKAKESLSNIGKNILKTLFPGMDIATNIGAKIGGSIKSLFSGPKTQESLPKLAKGGIVTRPTEAIVGEAGPEAILPLDKLGSFGIDGFKASTNKMIPKFMKLLTLPFSIVGAGLVALISATVSKIPGIGQFILPLISNIASGFGLPAGLISGMTNFAGGVTSAVSGGLGNIAELFGKNEVNIRQQKGEEFSPGNDTSVKGLLGDILGALISKQKKPATTPGNPPAGASPAPPASPAGTPATPPAGTPPAPEVSPIFTYPSRGEGGVPGQGTGDKVPALLEPNEYVLNRNAVRGLGGPAVLDKINFGMYPRFQAGGSILDKLGDSSKLASAPKGYCVTGVLDTMAKNNVSNPAGTSNDPNNPRGLASQLIKSYGWGSIPNLGSPINLRSAYGNVGANAMTFSEWKDAVKSNKIASGSIIFTTRNSDWTGNQSSGHDAAIAKQGGRKLWSGHWQSQADGVGAVYGTSSNKIIALTPGGKQVSYDGSRTSDDGKSTDGEDSSAPSFTGEMAASAAENLGKLFQMLTGPAPTTVPESVTPQTPKITTSVSANSGNLQRVQRENLKVQAQSRQQTKGGGNVITLGEPNKTITESRSQPMTSGLGDTTAPNPLINYPIAP